MTTKVCPECGMNNTVENLNCCMFCGVIFEEPELIRTPAEIKEEINQSVDSSNEPNDDQEKSNVVNIQEAASKKVEVITNTKEERQMLERTHQINKHIGELLENNNTYAEKAAFYEHLAETLDFEPFMDLKKLVSSSLHENIDNQDVKKLKDGTKNFEAIDNIEKILRGYEQIARDYRYDIEKNLKTITELYEEQAEINEKLNHYQTKLF